MMCLVPSGSACVQVTDSFLFKTFLTQEAVAVQGMQLTAISQNVLVT